ncbi:MAG: gliding motility-associated ABC transporter ATP-binding subunit GldA, partial [Flavobacteriales bacterium]|nr:gliding motility-associated ABC transporter ATP-binding subunit GldA [Flavobacteriales bacterium]
LKDVTFDIKKGEVVGFLGPNGAGKSTMMKIISCYLPQNQGKVEVAGYDVVEDSIEVRKRVGYLPEHNPLYLDMYVKEYLKFVGGVHKIDNAPSRVSEMIDLVGLGREQHKKIGALSKGYRQRVGLAQAMIHDPKVLILDEPTSGLDPNQLVDIRALIQEIGKEKTVMLSTHIMQEVEAICNRVIIINQGEIVADKAAATLRSGEEDTVTLKVEFSDPVEENVLSKIDGVKSVKHVSDNTWLISSEASRDLRKAIFNFAVESNNSALTIQREERKLEDVFKELTGK